MTKLNTDIIRSLLKAFDFKTLFVEHLGWNKHKAALPVAVDGTTFTLSAVAQKCSFVVYVCPTIPADRAIRMKIDGRVTKTSREHLIIYTDEAAGEQLWEWVRREPGKPIASRNIRLTKGQSAQLLIEKLGGLYISLEDEEASNIVVVAGKAKSAFDVEKVTKRFYDRFKTEHAAFMKYIKGIDDDADHQWYTSLMLNRLMFVYFIQKKGFLDGDNDYLRNRLARVRELHGKDKFHPFYRHFLLRLFHDGLGKRQRNRELDELLGTVPFLNGGFFEVHDLETKYADIDIPDKAFDKLFAFFDEFNWHLDERPLKNDKEINPDVVGYIFEKYINQKQMGAYYTKEDITEYISKNTIIPFLFDAAEKKCTIAFKPESALWRPLKDNPDAYIYPAVRHGVIRADGSVVPESDLPDFVQKGMRDPKARMHDKRYNLQQAPKDDPIRLITETWREYVARRTRCLDNRQKLRAGDVHKINDLITLNLDIWQFARDAIVYAEGPELLRAFYQVLAGDGPRGRAMSVLDPTCGSGAFLFAALRILETLYSDCLERMRRFVDDAAASAGTATDSRRKSPPTYDDFKEVLAELAPEKHPNERYFVLKSIIVNNLFGVDIMEEAVEICKLRLFLKLVAQVEYVEQIEPLPDIDFNIRAGNTLVGYVSLNQLRDGQKDNLPFDFEEELKRIELQAGSVEKIATRFREMQLHQENSQIGAANLAKTKSALEDARRKLAGELDGFLAGEYGIFPGGHNSKKSYEQIFANWQQSHHPFHWLVEFFGIMHAGGFDVIIGNPPYINAQKITSYSVRALITHICPDIYACFVERVLSLLSTWARCGLITPISFGFSMDFAVVRTLAFEICSTHYFSSFARIPAALFSADVRVRNTIWLSCKSSGPFVAHTTRLHRWFELARETLFAQLEYACFTPSLWQAVPKIAPTAFAAAFETHLVHNRHSVATSLTKRATPHILYWKKTAYNWLNCCRVLPPSFDAKGRPLSDVNYGTMYFRDAISRDIAFVTLNSSLVFLYWCIRGDDLNVPLWVFADFPIDIDGMGAPCRKRILALVDELETAMTEATSFKLNAGKRVGNFNLAKCRHVTRHADAVLRSVMNLEPCAEQIETLYAQLVKTDFDDNVNE